LIDQLRYNVVSEKLVNILKPGDLFRNWLVDILGERIRNKNCNVAVYKISPASHTVCRYDFEGEDYGVVAKFFAEPQGKNKRYNPEAAMYNEFQILKRVECIIDIPRPIAIRKDFSCVLVTENIRGESLQMYMESEDRLYDKLTSVAHLLSKLHSSTLSEYRKDQEFAHFHKVLDLHMFNRSTRDKYNRLLGKWWYSNLVDQPYGYMIHNDATPANYIFKDDKPYALDLESSWGHANYIHDLGVMAAEIKNSFALSKGSDDKAEPYIGHFIWNYCQEEGQFQEITRTLPFFMAFGLLRIARLHVSSNHRAYLYKEALACLNSKEIQGQSYPSTQN
jgi:tRNA A-37 threonylcarbamoyl transferase component Bud32